MKVDRLLVEGNLDNQILGVLLAGKPVTELGGSKYGLKAQAERLSIERKKVVRFVRDRDFDCVPPDDCTSPEPIKDGGGNIWGWYWCRHSMENYLLEPSVVGAAIGVDRDEYEDELRRAAKSIRFYEAARWAVGVARRALPPIRNLETRPPALGKGDFVLASDLSQLGSKTWVIDHTAAYLLDVTGKLNGSAVEESFNEFCNRFDEAFCEDTSHLVTWFSGKDLFGALKDWISACGRGGPKAFRDTLRNWCRSNPVRVLDLIPEWKNFVEVLRGETAPSETRDGA